MDMNLITLNAVILGFILVLGYFLSFPVFVFANKMLPKSLPYYGKLNKVLFWTINVISLITGVVPITIFVIGMLMSLFAGKDSSGAEAGCGIIIGLLLYLFYFVVKLLFIPILYKLSKPLSYPYNFMTKFKEDKNFAKKFLLYILGTEILLLMILFMFIKIAALGVYLLSGGGLFISYLILYFMPKIDHTVEKLSFIEKFERADMYNKSITVYIILSLLTFLLSCFIAVFRGIIDCGIFALLLVFIPVILAKLLRFFAKLLKFPDWLNIFINLIMGFLFVLAWLLSVLLVVMY